MARPKKPETQLKEIKMELAVIAERVKILKSKAGNNMAQDLTAVLAQISTLSTEVDALLAKPAAVTDLTPISDALSAISAKVVAATTA